MSNIFQQIKERLSITEVLSYYNVRKGRSKNSYYCPIHENDGKRHRPSLVASDKRGTAKCMSRGCFQCADIFSFIEIMENCSTQEALQKAAQLAGVSIPSTFAEVDQNRVCGLHDLHNIHVEWLNKRGIDTVTGFTFGLKAKGEFIAFPYLQDEKLTGWKLRSIYDKAKTLQLGPEKGDIDLSAKLWGFHAYKGQHNFIHHLIIVEGEPDCLRLSQSCFDNSLINIAILTSTTGAMSVPKDLQVISEKFPQLKRISILYDNDKPGKYGSRKIAQALRNLGYPIHIYNFPPSKKDGYDITDFLQEGNRFSDIFSLSVDMIASYYDARPAIEKFR